MNKQSLSKSDIKSACNILRMDDGVGASNYIEQLSWLLFLKVFENIESELEEISESEGKKYTPIIEKEYQWSSWARKDWKDKDELVFFINQKLFPYLKALKGTNEKEKVSDIFREITQRIHSPHTLLGTIDILNKIEMGHYQDTHLLSQVYEEILQELGSEGGWAGEFYTPRPIIRLMVNIVNPKLGETVFDPFVGSGGFLVEGFDHIQKCNPNMGVKEWDTLQRNTFYGQEKKPLPYLIGTMNMILHRILVPNLIRTNTLMKDIHNVSEIDKVDIVLTNPPFGGRENNTVQNNFPIKVSATEALSLQFVMRHLKNGGRCGIVLPESDILFAGGKYKEIREELLTKNNVTAIISLPKGVFKQVGADVKTYLVFFSKTGKTDNIWYYEIQGNFTKQNLVNDELLVEVFEAYKKKEIGDSSWFVSRSELEENGLNLRAINRNKNEIATVGLEVLSGKLAKEVKFLSNKLTYFEDIKLLINNNIGSFIDYPMSDLIKRNKSTVNIVDSKEYSRVTIKMHGLGINLRDRVKGSKIGTKKQFKIKEGQFLISKIDARNGAYGIVAEDCDGAIITGNFWAYDINSSVVIPEYFRFLLGTEEFSHFFELSSQGLTNRRYLQETLFLSQKVKLPSQKEQQTIVNKLNGLKEIKNALNNSQDLFDDYVQELINKIF